MAPALLVELYTLDIERLGWVSWQDYVQTPITKLSWLSTAEYSTLRVYMVGMQNPAACL